MKKVSMSSSVALTLEGIYLPHSCQWIELAMACLDQAGLTLAEQESITMKLESMGYQVFFEDDLKQEEL